MNCPYCQAPLNVTETVGGRPVVCPHCLSNIENPQLAPASVAPNVLRDIRSDGRPIRYWLWTLIALCVIGIILIAIVIQTRGQGESGLGIAILGMIGMAFVVGLLDILLLVAAVPPLWRRFRVGQQRMLISRVIGLMLLTMALIVAVVVFFGAACAVVIGAASGNLVLPRALHMLRSLL